MKAAVTLVCTLLLITCVVAQHNYRFSSPLMPTSFGGNATLTYRGDFKANVSRVYTNLTLNCIYTSSSVLRLRYEPTGVHYENETDKQEQSDFKIPYSIPDVVFVGNNIRAADVTAAEDTQYDVTMTNMDDGVVGVSRKAPAGFPPTSPVMTVQDIRFEEQLLSFSTIIPKATDGSRTYISGYAEHNYYYFINHDLLESVEDYVVLSLWNTDNGFTPWQQPIYGTHPIVFVSVPSDMLFYGILFLNSNAQRLEINRTDNVMRFTAIGGLLNVFVIFGDSQMDVLRKYHKLIGTSAVPPYWSLGTHQCRWGYRTVESVEEVVGNYSEALIPLEVMWNDIDYMHNFEIFTTDPTRYNETKLRAFVDRLHANGQKYVQIIDPGVSMVEGYSVYDSGLKAGVYVNRTVPPAKEGENATTEPLVNVVWPGWTVFPDFTAPHTAEWWDEQLTAYRERIPIDGAWLDMNEIGCFCSGYCPVKPGTEWNVDWNDVDWGSFVSNICMNIGNCTNDASPRNNVPYNPLTNDWFVYNRTLDMDGELYLGKYYDTKSFYGRVECEVTYNSFVKQDKKRPFVLTRASFVGSGRYTAHWTGDNNAMWAPRSGGIADSVQGVLASGLFGAAMVGADIGGFIGNSTEELVVRWTQLGAFYTFMRNHNGLGNKPQEWYVYSENATAAIRTAISERYRLLPYFFSELLKSFFLGGPVLRHPSVQYPYLSSAYQETQSFFVGDNIYVIPVVEEGVSNVTGYVPFTGTGARSGT